MGPTSRHCITIRILETSLKEPAVRAGGPHQGLCYNLADVAGAWCGLVARTRSLSRNWLGLGMGLVRAGGPHQGLCYNLAGAWCGLVARFRSLSRNWLGLGMGVVRAGGPHQGLCFGWGLVRAGGPRQVSVQKLAGAWYGRGAGWWPAPGSLLQFGWGLVRDGGPHQVSVQKGLGMGLGLCYNLAGAWCGLWPAPGFCPDIGWGLVWAWCGLVARTRVSVLAGAWCGLVARARSRNWLGLGMGLVRAGGPHQGLCYNLAGAWCGLVARSRSLSRNWLGLVWAWCGLVARTRVSVTIWLGLGAGWWPAPGLSLLQFGWGLVRAGGPHQVSVQKLAGAWYGLGAGWWPAPGSLLQFGWGLVRAGGPRLVSVQKLAGAWYGLGAGWWPAPGSLLRLVRAGGPRQVSLCYNLAWAWCGLVARTRSLSRNWLGLCMGLMQTDAPHQSLCFNLAGLGAGWWPAPGLCRKFGWGLVWAWCGLVARPESLLQFGWGLVRAGGPLRQVSVQKLAGAWYGLGAGWCPAPGLCRKFGWGWVWAWCTLVARTRSLLHLGWGLVRASVEIWLGLGMGLVRAGGPHQVFVTIWLATSFVTIWLGLGAGCTRSLSTIWLGLQFGWGLVRAGGPRQVTVTIRLGLGAGWWPAPGLCRKFGWGFVRAWRGLVARARPLLQFGRGLVRTRCLSKIWLGLGAGWWPAPGLCRRFGWGLVWAWCGLVARTKSLLQFGWGLVRATRSLSKIWLGLGMGLARAGGTHQVSVAIWLGLRTGWWPAPGLCRKFLQVWAWRGLVARARSLLQFG